MRHPVTAFGFVLLALGIGSMAWSQTVERPHLELVRGLRKEGMSDLALQYLEKLKTGKLDAETANLLELEFARTWLDMAGDESEESKRNALISQAKQKLEAFIKANPKHEKAAEANVDLARMYAVRGKTMIRKAKRLEDKKELEAEMVEARKPLQEAAKRYRDTAAAIEAQAKALEGSKGNEKKRRDLLEFQLQAQLDEGITLYSLGDTYVGDDTKDVKAQGDQYKAALKLFEKIMYTDEKLPVCWIARAWAAQAQLKAGDAGASEKIMNDLLAAAKNPAAAAGNRVGRYFRILNSFGNSEDVTKLEKETESWLRDFPAYRDSPEGLGARYYLAIARRQVAFAGIKFDKSNKVVAASPGARAKLEDAQRLFKELSETDNEYAERASRNRSQILVTLADADGQGDAPPLDTLTSFERAYLVAQVQIARFVQFRNGGGMTPPSDEAIKKEEHKRYANALKYLEHALKVAIPGKDNARDVFAAQLFLASCYNEMKMYAHAALLAEHMARQNPKMPKAGAAASFAVGAYNRAQIDLKRLKENAVMPEGDAERQKAEKIWDDKFAADINRMRKAASYVINTWPEEGSTDEARHLVAFYAAREKRLPDAWKAYAGIKNGYPAVQVARLELASTMFTMVYPADERDPARFQQLTNDNLKKYDKEWKSTLNLLESTPVPGDEAIPIDVLCYGNSRAQLARMYQLEGSQEKAEKVAVGLLKEVDRFKKATEPQKVELKQTAQNIALGAIRAQAYAAFKAGNHARVAELMDPQIEEITKDFSQKLPDEPPLSLTRLRKTQREAIVLALQSCVQDGKIKRASDLLELLERSGGTAEESMGMMQTLVSNVRGQLDDLDAAIKAANAAKNVAEADAKMKEAKALKDGFTELLEKLISQGNSLPLKMRLFLAQGLSSVEAFDKAAAELDKIRKMPPPQQPAEPPGNATDEQQAKFKRDRDDFEGFASYKRRAEYLLARNYRQAKDYTKALAVFNDIIGPVSTKQPTPKDKQGWAFASMTVRKEKAAMMEEMAEIAPETLRLQRWAEAVQEWIGIARTFSPRLDPLRQSLAPLDEAKKIFLTGFTARDLDPESAGENEFSLARLAWFGHQYGPAFAQERAKAAKSAEETATRRDRYFDLFFEQKRCSVKAFKALGPVATKGDNEAWQAKFAGFAKEFKDLQDKTKNPDLSPDIKGRIKQLVDSVPELKREYDKLGG